MITADQQRMGSWKARWLAEAALDAILDLLDSRAEEWGSVGGSYFAVPDVTRALIAALRQPQEGV
jgi:hypothetical protein